MNGQYYALGFTTVKNPKKSIRLARVPKSQNGVSLYALMTYTSKGTVMNQST